MEKATKIFYVNSLFCGYLCVLESYFARCAMWHYQETYSLQVVMDNEILQVTISNPQGIVTGIKFRGMDNLLEVRNPEIDRGYVGHKSLWESCHTFRQIPSRILGLYAYLTLFKILR